MTCGPHPAPEQLNCRPWISSPAAATVTSVQAFFPSSDWHFLPHPHHRVAWGNLGTLHSVMWEGGKGASHCVEEPAWSPGTVYPGQYVAGGPAASGHQKLDSPALKNHVFKFTMMSMFLFPCISVSPGWMCQHYAPTREIPHICYTLKGCSVAAQWTHC